MSMFRILLISSLCAFNVQAEDSIDGFGDSPDLGESIDGTFLKSFDYVILPNGDGLPTGRGNALEGAQIYVKYCETCHGAEGTGRPNDRLSGGVGSIDSAAPLRTVGSYWPYATTLLDYVRRAMPYTNPGTLSNNELYAITAYVLNINGIVKKNEWMDADSLPRVRMPNEDGFESALGDHSVKFRRETLHHQ